MARRHLLHLCEISAHSMFCVSICAYCAPVSAAADCTQTCEDMCTSLVWVSCVAEIQDAYTYGRGICNVAHALESKLTI